LSVILKILNPLVELLLGHDVDKYDGIRPFMDVKENTYVLPPVSFRLFPERSVVVIS